MSNLVYRLTDGTEAVFKRDKPLAEIDKILAEDGLERDKTSKPFAERGATETALAKVNLPIAQGVSNILGLPGGFQQLLESVSGKIATMGGYSPEQIAAGRMGVQLPRPSDITKAIGEQIPLQRAESFPGRVAQTAVRNIASAPIPGAIAPSLLSAGGEEALAFPFRGTSMEPLARSTGAILTPLISAPTAMRSPMERMYTESTQRMTPREIEAASQLQKQSFNLRMPVTSFEAMQQAAQGRTTLPSLQRQVEGTPSSAPTMAEFMGTRGRQTQETLEQAFPMTERQTLGTDVQRAASQSLRDVERQITKEAGPAFEAIKTKKIPQTWLTKLEKDNPVLAEASRIVDNSPAYQQLLQGYAPNSVARIEAMRQYLDDRYTTMLAQNNGKVTSEMRAYQEAKTNLLNRTDDIIKDYKPAREQYQATRERLQAPLAETPIIPMAETNELSRQFGDLFAKNPAEIGLNPKKVATTVKELGKRDPNLPKDFLNQYMRASLENVQRAATAQAGTLGPRFADTIVKNTTQRENLRAAFREVYGESGASAVKGLNTMLDILETQGRRLAAGSPTAEKGMLAEESVSLLGRTFKNPLEGLGRAYQNIFYANDYDKIARAITSPDGVKQLEKIAKLEKNKRQQGLAIVEFQRLIESVDEPTNLGQ